MTCRASRLLAFFTLSAALLVLAPAAMAGNQRVCPGPAGAGTASCHARVKTDGKGQPAAATAPAGYGPAVFHSAYNLPWTPAAAGQVIAIVDAYDDPTAEKDLGVYSTQFGLTQCTTANGCFRKVNQAGKASPLPKTNAGWALEIALDVETAHGVCPSCKILLVEANSATLADLGTAVNTAAALGATVISNSYGGGETGTAAYAGPYNHPGVAILASTGDNGYGTSFPSTAPGVVAVGGTTLNVTGTGAWSSETAWSGAGSGCSSVFAAPAWQVGTATGCTSRAVADVSAVADPATGAAVYDSTRYQGRTGWYRVGGTSLSSPLLAGAYALAANSASTDYPARLAYSAAAGSLHDIVSGTNGTCGGSVICAAGPGFDGPTGLGTPNGLGAF